MLNKIERYAEQAVNKVARATRPLRSTLALEIAVRGAGALALVASLPVFEARAQAAFPSWDPSISGFPAGDCKDGMVPVTLRSNQGETVELIGGPMSYQDVTGRIFDFPGQEKEEDRASVVVLDGGVAGAQIVMWDCGNWKGNTDNPDGLVDLPTPLEQHLAADANRSLRDPNLGNGKDKNGVQGRIDWAKIGPDGIIKEIGQILPDGSLQLDYDGDGYQAPAEQPAQSQQVTQPEVTQTTGTTQPGFEGEQEVIPATQDIPATIQPGVPVRIPKGSIIRGEVGFRDPKTGQFVFKYDSNPETGLVTITDEDIDILSNYPASVIMQVSGDINVRAQGIAAEISANGCDGNGCSQGTFISHVPNGPFQQN